MVKTAEEIKAALAAPFPNSVLQTKQGGGGKALTYVPGWHVIQRLDDATNGWSFEVTHRESRWIGMSRWNQSTNQRDDYDLEVIIVEGNLTIPELGTRSGVGVQELQRNAGADVIKGAWTDAVKVAAMRFGVARYLATGEDAVDMETGEMHSPSQGHSAPQGGGNRSQGPGYQRGGQAAPGGRQASSGGTQGNPASQKQINTFENLTAELKIDREAVAKAIANYPLASLNKTGYTKVISYLFKVKSGEMSWNGPSAEYDDVQTRGGQSGGQGMSSNGGNDQWLKQIASAVNADKLDEIAIALNQFNLLDETMQQALDARADALGIP